MTIVNQTFNRLTVLEKSDKRGSNAPYYLCKCVCGNTKIISKKQLISSGTKSCGCLQREKVREQGYKNQRNPGTNAERNVYKTYKCRAKKRNLTFDIPIELFYKLIQQPCVYCDTERSNLQKGKFGQPDLQYNGLDRIDSNLGYAINNVNSCCVTCNRAKQDLTLIEFKTAIKLAFEYLQLKNNIKNLETIDYII